MTTTQEPTAFGLLLGELSGIMTPDQLDRVRTVFASWAGQEIHVPSPRSWLADAAAHAARRMLAGGTPTPVARDRLIGMGVSKTTAYKIIGQAREELRNARTA